MLRHSLSLGIAGIVLLSVSATHALAAPAVTIGGLSGAEHWVWVEAEHATGGTGATSFRDSSSYSGWFGNPNAYLEADESLGNIRLAITAPASMSANTGLYLRGAVERSTNLQVLVDDAVAASASMANSAGAGSGQSLNSVQFLTHHDANVGGAGLAVGALSQGEHSLQVRRNGGYVVGWQWDGFLLYDGNVVLPTGTVPAGGVAGNRRWIDNPSSADSPEIAGPVTPTFANIDLPAGSNVEYLLNGAAYTPGTEIGLGEHELVVLVRDGNINSNRIVFTGANFTVIPEPASVGLVVAGMLTALVRPRRHDVQ